MDDINEEALKTIEDSFGARFVRHTPSEAEPHAEQLFASVFPESIEEVEALTRLAARQDIPHLARGLIQLSSKKEALAPDRKGRTDVPALTPRQLEVLRLLSEGKSVREIGRELYLSEATVRNHVRSLLQALGAHSQLEVLARAREMGILSG